jgi:hypothetical protein
LPLVSLHFPNVTRVAHSLLIRGRSITMTSIPNGAEDVDLELVASLVHWDVLERAI